MRKTPHLPRQVNLGNWKFYRLMLKDRGMYSKYVKESDYNPNLYSSNFDFLWASSGDMYGKVIWKIIDGMLVVFRLNHNRTLQLAFLPLGPGKPEHVGEVLYKCALFCNKWNEGKRRKLPVVRVVNQTQLDLLNGIGSFQEHFNPVKLLGVDRHVGVQNLLNLKGGSFQNVRYAINRFHRDYPEVVTRRGSGEDYQDLVKLKQEWNQTLGKKYEKIRDELVYRRILKSHNKLDHIVIITELNGEIIGMITGGILPHGQAWAGLHKRKQEYSGISEYLYVELAREIHRIDSNVDTINLGMDAGAGDGLRHFKNKFRPVLNEERYALYLK